MRKLKFLTILILGFFSLCFADESITLTTYYPSPYGSYNDLHVANTLGIGTTTPAYPLEVSPNLVGVYTDYVVAGLGNPYSGAGASASSWVKLYGTTAGIGDTSFAFGTQSANFYLNYLAARATAPSFGTNLITIQSNGNVGIGTTAPTVKFERACPAGFTNIKSVNNQLGCMETALEGAGTWYTAANTCFTKYGGRLAVYSEWYVAMNNYPAITRPTGWEWLGNGDYIGSSEGCSMVGSGGSLTNPDTWACTNTDNFRCWIPR